MKRHIAFIFILLATALTAMAQSETEQSGKATDRTRTVTQTAAADDSHNSTKTVTQAASPYDDLHYIGLPQSEMSPITDLRPEEADSLGLTHGEPMEGDGPWHQGPWGLHEGFNAMFGASASVAFGKGAPRGVGFGETAGLAYMLPLGKRWMGAIGLMAHNMDWGGYHETSVGIGGIIGFKATDWLNLYVYGQKSFLPRSSRHNGYAYGYPGFGYGGYGYGGYGAFPGSRNAYYHNWSDDFIGAAAEFKINPMFTISVSFEYRSGDNPMPFGYGPY